MSDGAIYESRNDLAKLISAAVNEVVNQREALGITWGVRIATVASAGGVDPGGQIITATLDGDTVPMGITNWTGAPLAAGDRVAVLRVPPSGNFAIGFSTVKRAVGATATASGQSIPNGAGTNINWTAVSYDSNTFAGTTPFTNFTIPTGLDGVYAISSRVAMTGVGGTRNFLTIGGISGVDARAFFGSGESACNTTVVLPLVGGDSVFVQMLQNSGAPQTTTAAAFSIYRVA